MSSSSTISYPLHSAFPFSPFDFPGTSETDKVLSTCIGSISCEEVDFYTKLYNKIFTTIDISKPEVEYIIGVFKSNLGLWQQVVQKTKKDLHLRTNQTGLSVIVETNRAGDTIIPLKGWGEMIGKGKFRHGGQALLVSHPRIPLVAHLTQTFTSECAKRYSDSEVRILQIIRELRKKNSRAKGLIKFYGFVDYLEKNAAESIKIEVDSGYESKPSAKDSGKENQSDTECVQKRALVMKLYRGGNLEQNIHKLSITSKLRVIACLLSSLEILHSAGIFHSDLKPDNIFLEIDPKTGEVLEAVIGDFGFACDLRNSEDCYFKNGFVANRAPELKSVLKGANLESSRKTLAADVYSMGLIISWMFTSEKVPTWLDQLIERMTFDNPAERPTARICFAYFQANSRHDTTASLQ